MIEAAALIAEHANVELWSVLGTFLRVGAIMTLLPAFGERSVPARVRFAVAGALTFICAPLVPVDPGFIDAGFGKAGATILAEVVTGAAFGILLRMFVFGLQTAGAIAAQSTSLSQIFGGATGLDPQPAMGQALTLAGLTLAVIAGLHLRVIEFVVTTYHLVPFGAVFSAQDMLQIGVEQVAGCFALGFVLAAPFVLASVIYNITLGVINKAMPQLMVAFVGAPAITAGGLIFLMLSAPFVLQIWLTALQAFLHEPWGFPR